MNGFFGKTWVKTAVTLAACAAAVYALVYIDVVLRARTAYMEGEKFMSWHENPALREAWISDWYKKEKDKLEKKLAGKKIDKDEYERLTEILEFTKGQKKKESAVKYAYIWYQTAVELFSPPESKWVKMSRAKMPLAKELWKKELRAKNIPFEDYMLD